MFFNKKDLFFFTLLFSLLLIISSPVAVLASVPSSWARDLVLEASYNGIGSFENDSFSDYEIEYQSAISREIFSELIFSFCEKSLKEDLGNSDFPQAFGDNRSYAANCLNNLGIVQGISQAEFGPQRPLSRQEAAVILVRALKVAGVDTSVDNESHYSDEQNISNWARLSIDFCYNNGIIKGSADKIAPLANLSYEQAIVLINRAGIKFGFWDKLPEYDKDRETVELDALPLVSKNDALGNYINDNNSEFLARFPDYFYKVDDLDKAIVLSEGDKTNDICVFALFTDDNAIGDWRLVYGQESRWKVIFDISYEAIKENRVLNIDQSGALHLNPSSSRMTLSACVGAVTFFLKDGDVIYKYIDPYNFHYLGNGVYREHRGFYPHSFRHDLGEKEFTCDDVEKLIIECQASGDTEGNSLKYLLIDSVDIPRK